MLAENMPAGGDRSGEEINGAGGRGFLLVLRAGGHHLATGVEFYGRGRAINAAGAYGDASCCRMRGARAAVGDVRGRRGRLAKAGREKRGSRDVNHFVILQNQKAE